MCTDACANITDIVQAAGVYSGRRWRCGYRGKSSAGGALEVRGRRGFVAWACSSGSLRRVTSLASSHVCEFVGTVGTIVLPPPVEVDRTSVS